VERVECRSESLAVVAEEEEQDEQEEEDDRASSHDSMYSRPSI
jgi:hypothetical protein